MSERPVLSEHLLVVPCGRGGFSFPEREMGTPWLRATPDK